MKILKLKSNALIAKLDRLEKKIGSLNYEGIDLNKIAEKPMIAIVGSRKLTTYGNLVVENLTTQLTRAGFVVVSGLAFGADISAHKACLRAGGTTVAVLPSGLNAIYPAAHTQIAKEITASGTLISEYDSKHSPRRFDFLDRNRIIAALSDAVIIPEATLRSGSLNTARHAREMNIPVFAVPGPINSPLSEGTNRLIKNGAIILTDVSDVLELLNIKGITSSRQDIINSNSIETLVLKTLVDEAFSTNSIQEKTNLDMLELQNALTMLEIEGKVFQDQIGNWHLS